MTRTPDAEARHFDLPDTEPFVPRRSEVWRELGVVRDAFGTVARARSLTKLPPGEGRPVLFIPGFRTGDSATGLFRTILKRRGFDTYAWTLGTNHGDVERLLPQVTARAETVASRLGGPIALVGTSLGGFLAREVARDRPDLIRRVVTLGSPVVGGPKYTQVGRTFLARGQDVEELAAKVERRTETPLTVPVTALYSRSDGVVAWPACIDRHSPRVEHVEIASSHVGLMFHAEAIRLTAERIRRDPPPNPA